QALAADLGKTTGELRAMAMEGKLTTTVIVEALKRQASVIDAEFAKLPLTIERSFVVLSNAWTKFIGEADQANGASSSIASGIKLLADNLAEVASALLLVGGVAAGAFAGRTLSAVGAYIASVRAAALANAEQAASASAAAQAALFKAKSEQGGALSA